MASGLSISVKIGCAPQKLNDWVKKTEVDSGKCAGVSSEVAEKMRALERESRELRKGEPVKAPLVQAHWQTHILRWPSSTAGRSDRGFYRRASGCARGRAMITPLVRVTMATADLQRAADCPIHVL